jgi:hypothetical protein
MQISHILKIFPDKRRNSSLEVLKISLKMALKSYEGGRCYYIFSSCINCVNSQSTGMKFNLTQWSKFVSSKNTGFFYLERIHCTPNVDFKSCKNNYELHENVHNISMLFWQLTCLLDVYIPHPRKTHLRTLCLFSTEPVIQRFSTILYIFLLTQHCWWRTFFFFTKLPVTFFPLNKLSKSTVNEYYLLHGIHFTGVLLYHLRSVYNGTWLTSKCLFEVLCYQQQQHLRNKPTVWRVSIFVGSGPWQTDW